MIVSWADITDDQLAFLLKSKTTIDELVVEDCSKLTKFSPTLDLLETVTSRLVFDNLAGVTSIELKSLTQAHSLSVINLDKVQTVSFSKLQVVNSSFRMDRLRVTTIDFGALKEIKESFTIDFCQNLPASQMEGFSALETVGGAIFMRQISMSGTSRESDMVFPKLKSVGSMHIRESGLRSLSFSRLESVDTSLNLIRLTGVQQVDFPSITSVGGTISFDQLNILSSLCLFNLDQSGFKGTKVASNYLPHARCIEGVRGEEERGQGRVGMWL